MKLSSIHGCSRKYLIDRKCIRGWSTDLDKFKELDKTNLRNNLPGDIEYKLIDFIKKNREQGITLNSHEIIVEAK